jgi:hypothetical protein
MELGKGVFKELLVEKIMSFRLIVSNVEIQDLTPFPRAKLDALPQF